jgi:hypothetical protein
MTLVLGCRSPVFHVKAVNPDASIDVIGTFDGKEYSLTVSRENAPLYVAHYEPIQTEDVGKDFPAEINGSSLFVDIPAKGRVRYDIQSVREVTSNR